MQMTYKQTSFVGMEDNYKTRTLLISMRVYDDVKLEISDLEMPNIDIAALLDCNPMFLMAKKKFFF